MYKRQGLIVLSLAGCGTGVATSSGSSVTSGTFAFSGQVEGGQQPVNGATISLYAAGKTALASAPRSMLTSSAVSYTHLKTRNKNTMEKVAQG